MSEMSLAERTKAGLKVALARGRMAAGISLQAETTAVAAEALYKEKSLSIFEICEKFGISRSIFTKFKDNQATVTLCLGGFCC